MIETVTVLLKLWQVIPAANMIQNLWQCTYARKYGFNHMVASIWANPFVDRAGYIFHLLADSGTQMKALTQKVSIFHEMYSVGCLCFPKFLTEIESTTFFSPTLSINCNKNQSHNAKFSRTSLETDQSPSLLLPVHKDLGINGPVWWW